MAQTAGGSVVHDSLAAALVAFQAECPKVAKNKTATIPGKNGATGYKYKYADLADVADAAYPILTRHGLSFTCGSDVLDNGAFVTVGLLAHVSGGERRAVLPCNGSTPQAIGSAITYNRRYLLGMMTGIITDEDEDGAGATNADAARTASEPPHQTALRERIEAELDDDTRKAFMRWWTEAEFGALKSLTAKKASEANDLLTDFLAEQGESAVTQRLGAQKVDDKPDHQEGNPQDGETAQEKRS